MKSHAVKPHLAAIPFLAISLLSACGSAQTAIAPNNLDESKAKITILVFFAGQPSGFTFPNAQLTETGPIIIDGSYRRMDFKLTVFTSDTPQLSDRAEYDGSARFGLSQEGKWYLTDVTYSRPSREDYPGLDPQHKTADIEVK